MRNGSGRRAQRGFTYLAAMVLVALLGAGLAAYGETWTHAQQRGKEAELIWIGNQFREAIGLYYQRTPGAVKHFPRNLDDLLEDKRFLTRQRYLRRLYADPFTGKNEWGLVQAPGGGIAGVYSRAEGRSIGRAVIGRGVATLPHGVAYKEWKFAYEPPQPPSR
jgi:type II secretory pathway pseudopilin PulG